MDLDNFGGKLEPGGNTSQKADKEVGDNESGWQHR